MHGGENIDYGRSRARHGLQLPARLPWPASPSDFRGKGTGCGTVKHSNFFTPLGLIPLHHDALTFFYPKMILVSMGIIAT